MCAKDLLPQLSSSATSNGEQRVRVLVPNAKGLHRTTQFLMRECYYQQREGARRVSRNSNAPQWCGQSRLNWQKHSPSSKLKKSRRRQMTRRPIKWYQKPNASGNQTQAQWSFATEAWLEVTYGVLSPTCWRLWSYGEYVKKVREIV